MRRDGQPWRDLDAAVSAKVDSNRDEPAANGRGFSKLEVLAGCALMRRR